GGGGGLDGVGLWGGFFGGLGGVTGGFGGLGAGGTRFGGGGGFFGGSLGCEGEPRGWGLGVVGPRGGRGGRAGSRGGGRSRERGGRQEWMVAELPGYRGPPSQLPSGFWFATSISAPQRYQSRSPIFDRPNSTATRSTDHRK